MVDAVVFADVAPLVEAQIDGLAHFAFLEERWIALCRHFDDLVLGWMQLHLVFASGGIWTDGQRVARHVDVRCVLVVRTEVHVVARAAHGFVVLLADEVGGVVALQLHDNLQRFAQIVLRQVLAEWLAALHVATHHAAAEHHRCGVPNHG